MMKILKGNKGKIIDTLNLEPLDYHQFFSL